MTISADEAPHIQVESSALTTRNIKCALHKWNPPETCDKIRGVAVVYHGFGAHSLYPTVRYASSLLAENGFIVYGLDFPGHGSSDGKRGLLTGVEDLLVDAMAVVDHAKSDAKNIRDEDLPLFLVGSSMGGAIALAVSRKMEEGSIRGIVMLAPMLSLKVSSLERTALGLLSVILPSAPIIPSSATSPDKQYRDPERRDECEKDTMTYRGSLRVSSARTCVELAVEISQTFEEVRVPFLCMLAEEDVVVDNSKVTELMEKAKSEDKTLNTYSALHGLLCEPAPLLGIIEDDLIQWLLKRCP